jgi:hypothetical protein
LASYPLALPFGFAFVFPGKSKAKGKPRQRVRRDDSEVKKDLELEGFEPSVAYAAGFTIRYQTRLGVNSGVYNALYVTQGECIKHCFFVLVEYTLNALMQALTQKSIRRSKPYTLAL